jgi:diacylglycerol kinase (ATP)
MRALLVLNAHSRMGAKAGAQVTSALEAAGLSVDVRACRSPDDLSPLISHAADTAECVILGGGDGTLNAALPGLIVTKLPLGIIPLGTANDLARTLAIPSDLTEAAQVIAAGNLRAVDVGEVNGYPYFNVASVGFGVDLTRALTRDAKRRWGKLGYLVAAFRVLRRMRPFHATIKIGDTVHITRTVHLAVGNGRHYGGGMTLSEDAAIDDNRLDVYSLEVSSAFGLIKLLPSLRSGRHGRWAEVETMAGQEVMVETSRPRSVNADGEIKTRTPAHFRVLKSAVRVYAPVAADSAGIASTQRETSSPNSDIEKAPAPA